MLENFSFSLNYFARYCILPVLLMLIGVLFYSLSNALGLSIIYIGTLLFLFLIYLFRDPSRNASYNSQSVYSPCDGIVTRISRVQPDPKIYSAEVEVWAISIKNSFFCNYIRRAPFNGNVESFFSQSKGKDSSSAVSGFKVQDFIYVNTIVNDREAKSDKVVWVDNVLDITWMGYSLISPLYTSIIDDLLSAGKKIGIVPFGSTLIVYIPSKYQPCVVQGQHVIGGETMLATNPKNLLPN